MLSCASQRVWTSFLMHLGRTILHLWLRKQHICVDQTKSICRENTVLKFLGLVSHSQGYGSASDCSTLTPLSASTPRRKLQILSKMHVYDTYHILHPLNSGNIAQKCWRQCSHSWNIFCPEQVWIWASPCPPELEPLDSQDTGAVPEVAAARTGMDRNSLGVLGSLLLLLGLSQTIPAKKNWVRKSCLKVKPTNLVMTSGSGWWLLTLCMRTSHLSLQISVPFPSKT